MGLGLVGFLAWAAVAPGVWHDDGAYLLLGKSLADGEGLRYSRVPGAPPDAKFPPLYPMFLALLWRVAPEAVEQRLLGSLFNVLFLATSGGLFVAYLRSLKFSWRSSVAASAGQEWPHLGGTPSEQFAVWSASGIEYVVLEHAGVVHQEAMDELDTRCPGAVQLQASWGGGMLVRLDWDDACRAIVAPGA